MIRINFNEAQLQDVMSRRFQRKVKMAYGVLWLVSLLAVGLQVLINQSLAHSYRTQILFLNSKTESLSPRFQRAVTLYEQRSRYKNKLSKLKTRTVDAAFVAEGLKDLAQAVPANFWIEQVEFSTLKKINSANTDKKAAETKAMVIRGRSFIDLNQENPEQVRNFRDKLRKMAPFTIAKSRLDLSKMKVGKIGEKYFHNFSIEFAWPNPLL